MLAGTGDMVLLRQITVTTIGFLVICMAVSANPVQGQEDVAIHVSLSRDTIGLDEHSVMEVTVSGSSQDLPKPKLPTLTMFEVYSQGQSSNISVVNGEVSASVTYRFLMMPQKSGTYPINNVSLVHRNKRYKGNPVTLTVLGQGSSASEVLEERAQTREGGSKDHFLEAEVDDRNPYVNEQVTLTLKFYIAVRYLGSPTLAEPSTTGFWTEIIGNKAPYQQRVNNRTYKVIERKYALFPTQSGALTIGRATINATIARRTQRRRDPFDVFGMLGGGEEVQVRSKPIKISVRELPEEGRPADYAGTIGRFRISAEPSKRQVEINQPVTVTVNIKGVGNIKSVAEPEIPDLDDFRIYLASSNESMSTVDDKIGGTRTFEEVFIPKRAGDLEIPSLRMSYFDPKTGKYKTVNTKPISLKVIRPEGYAATSELPYSAPDMTIGADARDIRFIKTDIGELQPKGQLMSGGALYGAVNIASVLLLAVTVAFRIKRERLSADVGLARSRAAAKQARKRLSRARGLASTSTATDFYTECTLAVTSYIADKLNESPHGLTSEKIASSLTERGAKQTLIDDTVGFLNQCGFARYTSSSSTQEEIDRALVAAQELMVRMEGVKF